MGDEVRASPARLRELGDSLHGNVAPHLQQAWNHLQSSRSVTQSHFTATSYVLAMAYAAAVDFEEEDLETKKKVLNKFQELLGKTGTNWESAEAKSSLGRP